MRAAKVQASLRIRAVSPEPSLLAHISSESRGTFRQKARSLAPLNGWACAVKTCHDGMLEDTNSLDSAHLYSYFVAAQLFKQYAVENHFYFCLRIVLRITKSLFDLKKKKKKLYSNCLCYTIVPAHVKRVLFR